ncbi:MAG TPA: NAD-dependent epimerase/dehydratase family protein [Gammaproteobacteria bacterium]|nr:NAD-dependent epimerase/dehydratase family protein [Gammaproteobacteria bacterium]
MTRVVVTGANGFVGRRVCAHLVDAGREVVAVVRDARATVPAGVAQVVHIGDIDARTDWRPALASGDVVVHLAARAHQGEEAAARADFQRINVDGTRGLVEAAAAVQVAQIVYLSSAKVYGECSWMDADGEPHVYTIDDVPHPRGPYGESKLAAEALLRERCAAAGIALTVLRPPLVYGPGNKANLQALLTAIARGVPLPLASIRNRRSLVHVDNLADAIARAIDTAHGIRLYTVADVDLSTPDLVRALALGLGRAPRLLPCPVGALRLLGRLSGRTATIERLIGSMVLDRARIMRELDWRPRVDLASAMRAIGVAHREASCR